MAPATFPALAHEARNLIYSAIAARHEGQDDNVIVGASPLGPVAVRAASTRRDDAKSTPDPTKGALDPHDINNAFVFVIFGLIGVAIIIGGIWFFFWAKNGGFFFQKDDWDDYKSTVMRRKGPNGTILSGATPSTQLGGGSVYKDVADHDPEVDTATRCHSHDGGYTENGYTNYDDDDRRTEMTESTGLTGITGGVSDFIGREKRRKKREQKEREKERRREEKHADKERKRRGKQRHVGPDGLLVDENAEAEAREQLRNYRDEKPARVGGINMATESSVWDGSNPSHSQVGSSTNTGTETEADGSHATSELLSHQDDSRRPPPSNLKNTGGIRKVYSVADRRANREEERLRAEARRARESSKGQRTSSRRGYNYQRADSYQHLRDNSGGGSGGGGRRGGLRQIDEQPGNEEETGLTGEGASEAPGRWGQSEVSADTGSEIGTKSYHHSIPGLSSAGGSGAGSAVGGNSSTAGTDFAYQEEKRKRRQSQRRSRQ